MNAYKQLKDKHQKEMDAFPLGVAFSDKQFEEMMQKWDLTVTMPIRYARSAEAASFVKATKTLSLKCSTVSKKRKKTRSPPIRPAKVLFTICSSTNSLTTNTALHTTTKNPLTRSA